MPDDAKKGISQIMASEFAAMSSKERDKFLKENPNVRVELDDEFWDTAEYKYDPNDPTKVISVGGPIFPKKGKKEGGT